MSRKPNPLLGEHLANVMQHDAALTDLANTRIPLEYLHVEQLRPSPDQARRTFPGHAALVASVLEDGVRTPLIVRALDGEEAGLFEIIAGERRWRAASEAALLRPERGYVPCQVRHVSEEQAVILGALDNLERENLNAYETAGLVVALVAARLNAPLDEVKRRLMRSARKDTDDGAVQAAFASAVEKLRQTLSLETFNRFYLPLLSLPADLRAALDSGLAYKTVLKLRGVTDEKRRAALIEQLSSGELSHEGLLAQLRGARTGPHDDILKAMKRLNSPRLAGRVEHLAPEERQQIERHLKDIEGILKRYARPV